MTAVKFRRVGTNDPDYAVTVNGQYIGHVATTDSLQPRTWFALHLEPHPSREFPLAYGVVHIGWSRTRGEAVDLLIDAVATGTIRPPKESPSVLMDAGR